MKANLWGATMLRILQILHIVVIYDFILRITKPQKTENEILKTNL